MKKLNKIYPAKFNKLNINNYKLTSLTRYRPYCTLTNIKDLKEITS